MNFGVQQVQYFYASVNDQPGVAYDVLTDIAGLGVNLRAFTAVPAVPMGPGRTQLTLFPEDPSRFRAECQKAGLELDGPHQALLV